MYTPRQAVLYTLYKTEKRKLGVNMSNTLLVNVIITDRYVPRIQSLIYIYILKPRDCLVITDVRCWLNISKRTNILLQTGEYRIIVILDFAACNQWHCSVPLGCILTKTDNTDREEHVPSDHVVFVEPRDMTLLFDPVKYSVYLRTLLILHNIFFFQNRAIPESLRK